MCCIFFLCLRSSPIGKNERENGRKKMPFFNHRNINKRPVTLHTGVLTPACNLAWYERLVVAVNHHRLGSWRARWSGWCVWQHSGSMDAEWCGWWCYITVLSLTKEKVGWTLILEWGTLSPQPSRNLSRSSLVHYNLRI